MSYPCPYLTHPVHVTILSLPVLTHHLGERLGVHLVIMLGGDHGVNWLGQVLADNIQILGGPTQGFVDWGATLAAMHDQQTKAGQHGMVMPRRRQTQTTQWRSSRKKRPYANPLHKTHV